MSGRRYSRDNQVYKGSDHPGANVTYSDRNISTLYNPFSIKNNTPKWPDGLANFSIGRKQQFASEIYGRDIFLVLFPGSNNWLFGYDTSLLAGIGDAHGALIQLNHGDDRTFEIYEKYFWDATAAAGAGAFTGATFMFDKTQYSAWRGVSYAMKIRCVNTDDSNDGWWEAIRVSKNLLIERCGIAFVDLRVKGTASYSETQTSIIPYVNDPTRNNSDVSNPVFWTGNIFPRRSLQNWWNTELCKFHEQPSFATGLLKDIGDFMFQLNPHRESNEFQKLKNVSRKVDDTGGEASGETDDLYMVVYDGTDPKDYDNHQVLKVQDDIDGGALHNYNGKLFTPARMIAETDNSGTAQPTAHSDLANDQIAGSFVSDSFDIIMVRIHATKKSRILVHSVANVELLCGEFSDYNQYQSVAYPDLARLKRYVDYRQTKCKLPMHTSDQYTS